MFEDIQMINHIHGRLNSNIYNNKINDFYFSTYCEKRFTNSGDLQIHVRIHTVCYQLNRYFISFFFLFREKNHMRVQYV
jgi:hypothetical protein